MCQLCEYALMMQSDDGSDIVILVNVIVMQ